MLDIHVRYNYIFQNCICVLPSNMYIVKTPSSFATLAGFSCFADVCVSLLPKYLKKYLSNEFHFWWMSSIWPEDGVIQFSEKSVRGKGGYM